jgi:hypothetical protein
MERSTDFFRLTSGPSHIEGAFTLFGPSLMPPWLIQGQITLKVLQDNIVEVPVVPHLTQVSPNVPDYQ